MCDLAARSLGLQREDIIVASTGVIGMPFDIQPIADNIDQLAASLSIDGAHAAATAIMTTDTVPKEIAVEFEIGGWPMPYRRHRKRFWDDSSQYGHYAQLYHHRCSNQSSNAGTKPQRSGQGYL